MTKDESRIGDNAFMQSVIDHTWEKDVYSRISKCVGSTLAHMKGSEYHQTININWDGMKETLSSIIAEDTNQTKETIQAKILMALAEAWIDEVESVLINESCRDCSQVMLYKDTVANLSTSTIHDIIKNNNSDPKVEESRRKWIDHVKSSKSNISQEDMEAVLSTPPKGYLEDSFIPDEDTQKKTFSAQPEFNEHEWFSGGLEEFQNNRRKVLTQSIEAQEGTEDWERNGNLLLGMYPTNTTTTSESDFFKVWKDLAPAEDDAEGYISITNAPTFTFWESKNEDPNNTSIDSVLPDHNKLKELVSKSRQRGEELRRKNDESLTSLRFQQLSIFPTSRW
ncbi:uncharacterized protein L201_003936 [Kwoniella dendrophila CBS 6074]|uniref:Uncharacterized protein n=1 Tax=Kwoniella dendrophila CBS 6074 TaxID=1295534 RepID=A0AAX4JVY5_9TREE